MGLRFPGEWRFTPPADGQFINAAIPESAVSEFQQLILKVALQGLRRWDLLEHFKSAFGSSGTSSNESWAEHDLEQAMHASASNAPEFIEQIFNGLERMRTWSGTWFIPDNNVLNSILARHGVGYEIRPPDLVLRETTFTPIPVEIPAPSLHERVRAIIEDSLARSQELLARDRPREAVQESLWILETVATAFRGKETTVGKIEGKYFNQIVRDLRSKHPGKVLDQILAWIAAMHGYLSSPTGGGIRHGMDLESGVDLEINEARLFCNLIRSYVQFLLVEYESLIRSKDSS